MGMAASQARLLSITARLTDNELRSQTITNSKLRLAEKSSEASQEYMNALNSEKLTFKYYNDNGESTSYNLTPALLYSYEPLKNQYSLQNASGQNLVSATDAKNFEESNNLAEFLDKYGLVDNSEIEEYNKKLAEYNTNKAQYDIDLENYKTYSNQYSTYIKELEEYNKLMEAPDVYQMFSDIVGTSASPKSCYSTALNGREECYQHVLAHLLDYDGGDTVSKKSYKASNGKQTNVMADNLITDSAIHSDGLSSNFKDISATMNNENILCDGDDNSDDFSTKENIIQKALDEGRTPTELEILKSDYVYDATNNKLKLDEKGQPQVKTLKQKAVDLLYILQNKLITDKDEMKETLINFTEGDMKKLTPDKPVKPTEVANPGEAPVAPSKPQFDVNISDKDKGQWYINLWYLMNGSESANKVKSSTNSDDETVYGINLDDNGSKKNQSTQNYKVIEDELLTSTDWLEFALKNGIVTLSQASYFNPTEDNGKVAEYTSEGFYWDQKPYTNASDIVSVQDDAAIARAEVKYKNATTEIENKDKKYDQNLKKLDTEHNALQTEYESLKNVIDKNVERSFKAFS